LKWDGSWCPCCGCRLRTSPRNSKFKAEFRARKEIAKTFEFIHNIRRKANRRKKMFERILIGS
jgi:hypothetical protein